MVNSADIASSVEKTCQDIGSAMVTYVRCPRGGRVRTEIIVSIDQLHERLGHLLACLARKHKEEM